ncbi:hypothetical protein D779_3584 [Imhoffiella purpurea]|uniref:Uncharacterized protein n=2 Tax=Imhoffiella purpurea TaxID=1249627 RepID=W9V9L9_9GAMM|nr:hypothetical protein D779_3584 [Imhoffiella purpurea]
MELLTDPETSEALEFRAFTGPDTLSSRYELGQRLAGSLGPHDRGAITNDPGVWNWLALFFFESLCPVRSDGVFMPGEDANFILSPSHQKRPRHAVRTTYVLVREYGDRVRFLFSKLRERGELLEQIAATQYLWSCRGVIEAASVLYQDDITEGFKRGAASKGPGSARRFRDYLSQLTLTYDLHGMTAEEILEILPREYERFLS